MRPNIDIGWGIHGLVKEHADSQDLTLNEAYRELIIRGAEQHGRVVRQDNTLQTASDLAELENRIEGIEDILSAQIKESNSDESSADATTETSDREPAAETRRCD